MYNKEQEFIWFKRCFDWQRMSLQRCENAVPKFLGNPAVPSTTPALSALEHLWGFLGVSLATSPRVHKACRRGFIQSRRVTNQLQGGRFAEAKCVWAKSISSPKPQDIAILILMVFFWSPRLSWGGRRESRKKRFLCALEAGLPLNLSLSAGVSQESPVRLQQPLCCCSSVPGGKQRQEPWSSTVQRGIWGTGAYM